MNHKIKIRVIKENGKYYPQAKNTWFDEVADFPSWGRKFPSGLFSQESEVSTVFTEFGWQYFSENGKEGTYLGYDTQEEAIQIAKQYRNRTSQEVVWEE